MSFSDQAKKIVDSVKNFFAKEKNSEFDPHYWADGIVFDSVAEDEIEEKRQEAAKPAKKSKSKKTTKSRKKVSKKKAKR